MSLNRITNTFTKSPSPTKQFLRNSITNFHCENFKENNFLVKKSPKIIKKQLSNIALKKAEKMSTLLLFIVDESLSMRTRKQQIVDGINQFLDVQRQIEGPDARLILIKFNSVVTFLHKGTKLSEVEPLKLSDYNPAGRTACFDAIVQGVEAANALRQNEERILSIILTDGEDTASVENQVPKAVRKLVRAYEAKPDWSFTFIGRPPDAWCRQKPVSKVSYESHVGSSMISQKHKNITSATRRLREYNSRRASLAVLIPSR